MRRTDIYPNLGPYTSATDSEQDEIPIAHPVVPSFEVVVPQGSKPRSSFSFQTYAGETHEMTVPIGTKPNQVLTVVVLPPGYPPGSEMLVETARGVVAITVPDVPPGWVIVVDVGGDIQAWGTEHERCCLYYSTARLAAVIFLAALVLAVAVTLLISAQLRRPLVDTAYRTQLSDNYQAVRTTNVNTSQYPGYNEGFVRGVDATGSEVYRYERDEQVESGAPYGLRMN